MEKDIEQEKKVWPIIRIVIAIVVILLLLIALIIKTVNNSSQQDPTNIEEPKETGTFTETSFISKGVNISIKSTEAGHPEDGTNFTANFSIKNEDGDKETYKVDYLNVEEWQEDTLSLTVNINKKEFIYLEEESLTTVDLYYIIPNYESMALHIKITGISIFDKNGQQCKCLPTVDKELLESKELAGIINFETLLVEE